MYVISEKPSQLYLPFVDTYMYTSLYILSGERLEPVYFEFHVQRQIDLPALKYLLVKIIVLNPIKMLLHSHYHTIPYVLNGIDPYAGPSPLKLVYHTINVMKWLGFSCILAF